MDDQERNDRIEGITGLTCSLGGSRRPVSQSPSLWVLVPAIHVRLRPNDR
jgi:hypothetical protein